METKRERLQEYERLKQELELVPDELHDTVSQALEKGEKRRWWKLFGLPTGGLAAVFCSFVIMVNTSFGFALAMGNIPVIGNLAWAVALSPSLKMALEHDYVQVVEETQADNGVSMTVEYIIVDQRQASIFYSLKGVADWDHLIGEVDAEVDGQPQSVAWTRRPEKGELGIITVYFQEDAPEHLSLLYDVCYGLEYGEAKVKPLEGMDDVEFAPLPWYGETSGESTLLWDPEDEKDKYLAEFMELEYDLERELLASFTFQLSLDSRFISVREHVAVGQWLDLDGQRIHIRDLEIYPTHVKVNIEQDPDNSATLQSISISIVEEDDQEIGSVTNGLVAIMDEAGNSSFYLDSNYFIDSSAFQLKIEDAFWLAKDRPETVIDLQEGTASYLPETVVMKPPVEYANGWCLTFAAQLDGEAIYQIFQRDYEDIAGNEYSFSSTQHAYVDGSGDFMTWLMVEKLSEDIVILRSDYSHRAEYDPPLVLEITR